MRSRWKLVLSLLSLLGLGAVLCLTAALLLGWQPLGVLAAWQRRGLPPIRLGLLHSQTGSLAISEKSILDAEVLAIEEVNADGGINGREVLYSYPDCRSDAAAFAAEARRLIRDEKAVALFGCWTSESRKAVLPVLDELKSVLFFPGNFEGVERSSRVIYAGGSANQSVLPAVRWAYDALDARRYFVVGLEEVWSRCSAEIAKDGIKAAGAEVVGESFAPAAVAGFDRVAEAIRAAKPDVVLNFLYGDANPAFYAAMHRAGVGPDKQPVVAFGFGEDEARRFPQQGDILNQYAAWSYFQSVERPENAAFIRKFHARFEPTRAIGDPMVAAYNSIKFWAQAAREVGVESPTALVSGLLRQSMSAPDGIVTVDVDSQAFWRPFHVGQLKGKGQFEIIWSIERPIRPVLFIGTRSAEEWTTFLDGLNARWRGRWSAGPPGADDATPPPAPR